MAGGGRTADGVDDRRGGRVSGLGGSPGEVGAGFDGRESRGGAGFDGRESRGGAGFDGREFRRVLGHYPTGVTVVTVAGPDGPAGLTIGSFTSVSMEPPLVSFCLGQGSFPWTHIRSSDSFCVNVLADDQVDLCAVFASTAEDRFRGVVTRMEATGAPVIEGCLAWIDCRMHGVYPVGDHDIVVGEVVALATADAAAAQTHGPLLFFKGDYGRFEGL